MRNNRLPITLGLIVLILIGGIFAHWFTNNFEYVSEQVRGNMGKEARRNPLLAAEYYLSRLGISVQSHSGRQLLVEPPPQSGLLLVRDLGPPLPESRVVSLLAWVERGGHLVVTPGNAVEEGSRHPLLEHFGVGIETDEFDEREQAGSVMLPWSEVILQVDFDSDRWFSVDRETPYFASPDDAYPHLLRFSWGAGKVTFLSDNNFLTNTQIGEKDHALLLAYLADDVDDAWLLYDSQVPSLLTLLWRNAPYLMISLVLFGIVAIRQLQYTTGPLLTPRMTKHRDLLEHLQASAGFAWRYNPSVGLLEASRREVEKRWLASHPVLQPLDQKARCNWLAKQTGMTAESIHRALYSEQGDTGQLIKTTTNLQRLFAALHPERNEYNGSGSRLR
ncbi:MAG: hypothetical protein B6D79_08525 [gamma proteobacterium symbiont of Ctena orbiculata]|nr:MAG: hypothetical protein B6D79_08525 [gamma proteobacterium symbiont of Ctena orbiculata]